MNGRFIRGTIYGVGVDDVDGTKEFSVNGKRTTEKCFSTWKNIIKRCYHPQGDYYGRVVVDKN